MDAPTRVRIWEVLRHGPRTVRQLADALEVPFGTVSKTLRRWPNAVSQGWDRGGRGQSKIWSLVNPLEAPYEGQQHTHMAPWRTQVTMDACVVCGTTEKLVIHRIDGNQQNTAPDNLEVLCRSCHGRLHWARRMWARIPELLSLSRFPDYTMTASDGGTGRREPGLDAYK